MAGDGWLKLHRKALDSEVFREDAGWRLFTYLLLRATWTRRQLIDGTWLEPGELICSYRRMAEYLGWTKKKVEHWMRRLGDKNSIRTRPLKETRKQVISICNWETYQSSNETEGDSQGDTQGDKQGDTQGDIKKKGRKKEGKKGPPKPPFHAFNLDDIKYPEGMDTPEVRKALEVWLAYKKKRTESYKDPASQLSLLLDDDEFGHDPQTFVQAVKRSKARNWAGCFSAKGNDARTHRQSDRPDGRVH